MSNDVPEPVNTVRRRAGLPPYPGPQTPADDEVDVCTATTWDLLTNGPLRQCSEPAGHYDVTREPTTRGDEQDPGGWHRSAPCAKTGTRRVWSDGADCATPHRAQPTAEARCSGCGHTDGEGCGCPEPPFTTLEVRKDETPATLRELTDVVRELVAVMREDLDGRTEDAEETHFESTTPATTCSAQHRRFDDGRLCIRAAQHHGDHIDERGFHWSDTVAVYPVAKMISHDGPMYARPFEQRLPDWLSGTRDLSIPVQRADVQRDRDQYAAVLAEMLRQFTMQTGDPDDPRVRTPWLPTSSVEQWRSVVASPVERPWWEQVDELRAGRDRIRQEYETLLARWRKAEAAVERVRALADQWDNALAPARSQYSGPVRAALDGPAETEQPTGEAP